MSYRMHAAVPDFRCKNLAQKTILRTLCWVAQDDGTKVFPGLELMSRHAQLEERQVRRHLNELVKIGLIHLIKVGRGRGKATEYAINTEFFWWLDNNGRDLAAICKSGQNWVDIKSEIKPDILTGFDNPQPVDNQENRTSGSPVLEEIKPDILDPKTGHFDAKTGHFDAKTGHLDVHPKNKYIKTPPDPPTGQDPGPVAEDGVGDIHTRFAAFREAYPKPDAGFWKIWDGIERNFWPLIGMEAQQQAIASLPAYRKWLRGKGNRLCSPKTYLEQNRYEKFYQESIRRKDMDQTFVDKDEAIWPILARRHTAEKNPRGCPCSANGGRGWHFPNGWIMQAKRELANGPPDTGRDSGAGESPDADYAPGFDPP